MGPALGETAFLVYRYEAGNEAQMYGSLGFSEQGLGWARGGKDKLRSFRT